jgi:hypothetical protein
MVGKHSLPKWVHLAMKDVRPAHPLSGKVKATDP